MTTGTPQFVFGYGSLACDAGAALTRELDPAGFVAELEGMSRSWGVAMDNRRDLPGYKYYTDAAGRRPRVYVAYLDLAPPVPGQDSVLGVCLPVDDAALAALDARERNYARVDVSDRIEAGGARVWSYIGTPAGRRRLETGRAVGTAVIDANYLEGVRSSFAALGEAERRESAPSLDPGELPVVPLQRHELPPGAR